MSRTKSALAVVGAACLLVIGANAVSVAATGQSFILGKSNSANTATTLSRTTAGPVLQVNSTSTTGVPMRIKGNGLVANLNADRVDGLQASQLRTSVDTFEISPTGFSGSNFSMPIPLPVGRYLASYTGAFDDISGFTYCWFEQIEARGGIDGPVRRIIGESIYQGDILAAMNGVGVLTVSAGTEIRLFCGTDAGELVWQNSQPVQVTAQRILAGNGGAVLTFDEP